MTVEQRTAGRRTMLIVVGEVDLATSPQLRSAVQDALGSGDRELWIDLCATTFMDSSGVHVLLDAHRIAERLRRRLTIVCPPGAVRRVLELTGVTSTIRMRDA